MGRAVYTQQQQKTVYEELFCCVRMCMTSIVARANKWKWACTETQTNAPRTASEVNGIFQLLYIHQISENAEELS